MRKVDGPLPVGSIVFPGGDDVDEPAIGLLTDQFDDFFARGLPNRTILVESQGIVRAPPCEFESTLAPVASLPLTKNEGGMPIVVGVFVEPDRHLPAHIRLPVEGPFTSANGGLMKGTAGSVLEPRPVQEDAGLIDCLGDPLTIVVLVDRPTHFIGSFGELPLTGLESSDLRRDRRAIFLIDEVSAVGAASMLVLGSKLGENARAPFAVDASIVRREKSDIELPCVAILVVEGDPLMEVRGDLAHADGRYKATATVRLMAGDFDEIRSRLESISEELADLAILRLRESIDAGSTEYPVDEKRLTRARRAVEKAIHLLDGPDDGQF